MRKSELVAKAYARYIRVSPRKVRQVIDLIRGEKANRALAILTSVNKRAKVYVEKTLRSAISNARQNPAVKTDELFISRIIANNGPTLKRYRAAAMGRAVMIRHRTTHINVELSQSPSKHPERPKGKANVQTRRKPQKGRIRR